MVREDFLKKWIFWENLRQGMLADEKAWSRALRLLNRFGLGVIKYPAAK